ncbi:hypothetical protein PVK06_032199 [Gossypium arboreum]|uniref:Uncharacterized protein n=1 Tax=Gossypium arboreum TaxID=29729 RepID=A0ABR0NWI2_GOSAR|nr:hypothetical protein PVK06_032199 [Gossypium arboreum]
MVFGADQVISITVLYISLNLGFITTDRTDPVAASVWLARYSRKNEGNWKLENEIEIEYNMVEGRQCELFELALQLLISATRISLSGLLVCTRWVNARVVGN